MSGFVVADAPEHVIRIAVLGRNYVRKRSGTGLSVDSQEEISARIAWSTFTTMPIVTRPVSSSSTSWYEPMSRMGSNQSPKCRRQLVAERNALKDTWERGRCLTCNSYLASVPCPTRLFPSTRLSSSTRLSPDVYQ